MNTKALNTILRPFALLFTLLLTAAPLHAYDAYIDGIYYSFNSYSKTATVTYKTAYIYDNGNAYSGSVIIPSTVTYNDVTYDVTNIGDNAFQYCTSLTAVTIPYSITSIGSWAFEYCSQLSTLTLEDGTGTLSITLSNSNPAQTPFNDCPIQTLYLGRNVSYDNNYSPFKNKSYLSSLTIGENVTSIGDCEFYGCTSLTEVTIGKSVESIGYEAFYGCSSLTSVTIPNSVISIGEQSFSDCSSLTSVIIPNSVTSIGSSAFSGCSIFNSLIFEDGSETLSIANTSFNDCPIQTLYMGRNISYSSSSSPFNISLTSLTIGDDVTSIGGYEFCGCTSLTEVTIGKSVESIESNAFYGCSSLISVTIPNSVTSIGEQAFGNCTGLVELEYDATACTSAGYAFQGCSSLNDVTIGGNVTTIPEYTFAGCTDLTEVSSLSITPPTIYSSTFDGDVDVEVPIEALNSYALADCWADFPRIYANSGGSVYYPVPIDADGEAVVNVTDGDETGTVAMEGDVVTITPAGEGGKVYGLVILDEKEITDTLATASEYSFSVSQHHKENTTHTYYIGADNEYDINASEAGQLLTQITVANIPNVYKLKITGDINGTDITAIRRMTNLKVLDLSEANIVSGGNNYYDTYTTANDVMGDYFFYGMTSLKVVDLPQNATRINAYTFGGCTGLYAITLPKSITSIASYAFSGCTGILELTVEDGSVALSLSGSNASTSPFCDSPITTLYLGRDLSYNYNPFLDKTSLTSVTIGNRVSKVEEAAFSGCANLQTVTMGGSVSSIGDNAFYNCSSLSNVAIGSGTKSIGTNAFYNCTSLAEIYCKSVTHPDISSSTFSGVDKNSCILYVPTGSLNDYWLDLFWQEFFDIREMKFADDTDRIENTTAASSNEQEVARYTLDGKRIAIPQRGINIIRYSDGTVRKVLVP